jgi:hypothetical protein
MAEVAGKVERDLRLDLFRGLALFIIFIDHIPRNLAAWLTPQNFFFFDAAEMFIFIAGYSAALIYGRMLRDVGPLLTTVRIGRRCWQLWTAHMLLFITFTAIVSYTTERFDNPMFADDMGVTVFLREPHLAILNALLLRYHPALMDILPLYIVLFAVFPLILLILVRSIWAALALSFVIYVLAYLTQWAPTLYPHGGKWLFNPLSWLLLFTIGCACAQATATGRRPAPPARYWMVPVVLFLFCSITINLSWTLAQAIEGFPRLFAVEFDRLDKRYLNPVRIIDFLAFALLVVHLVRKDHPMLRSGIAQPIIRCGQNSLGVFCLGALLSYVGHMIMVEFDHSVLSQLVVNAGGIALLLLAGWILSWNRSLDRVRAHSDRMSARSPA